MNRTPETGFFYENTSLQTTDLVKNPVSSIEMRPGLNYSSLSSLPLRPLCPLRLKNPTIYNTDKDHPPSQNPFCNPSDKTPDSNR